MQVNTVHGQLKDLVVEHEATVSFREIILDAWHLRVNKTDDKDSLKVKNPSNQDETSTMILDV
jgi:hypothetical protein